MTTTLTETNLSKQLRRLHYWSWGTATSGSSSRVSIKPLPIFKGYYGNHSQYALIFEIGTQSIALHAHRQHRIDALWRVRLSVSSGPTLAPEFFSYLIRVHNVPTVVQKAAATLLQHLMQEFAGINNQ